MTNYQGGQSCDCGTCNPATVTSAAYPDGFPGYVYGGMNELKLVVSGQVCDSDVHLKLYYEPAIQQILERLDAVEAKLYGEVQPRLDALEAKDAELEGRVAALEAAVAALQAKDAVMQAEKQGNPMP